jgi:hypothetical protein
MTNTHCNLYSSISSEFSRLLLRHLIQQTFSQKPKHQREKKVFVSFFVKQKFVGRTNSVRARAHLDKSRVHNVCGRTNYTIISVGRTYSIRTNESRTKFIDVNLARTMRGNSSGGLNIARRNDTAKSIVRPNANTTNSTRT